MKKRVDEKKQGSVVLYKNHIEVKLEEETVWLDTHQMADLFGVDRTGIVRHIQNIYKTKELFRKTTCAKNAQIAKDGKVREMDFYNLDMIISVGYRVNSIRATQFRQWATKVLHQFAIKGFVLDKKRLENGTYLNENYFEELLAEIREIRLSERKFYQKVTDIYATSIDYNLDAISTKEFFSKVQNKLHFGIHGNTAAELIYNRADSDIGKMGLTSWKNSPDGKIIKTDVSIAKNYLTKDELESLGRIVNAYLDLAEERAKRKIPMTMQDWAKRLDLFLEYDDREVLKNSGKISAQIGKDKAESEFEKYRIIQDKLFESDFDKEIMKLLSKEKNDGK